MALNITLWQHKDEFSDKKIDAKNMLTQVDIKIDDTMFAWWDATTIKIRIPLRPSCIVS